MQRQGHPLEDRYDVLVAGGGNAGLCAAISARRAGASVLIVEAAPRALRGGNSRHTRNLRYAHAAANETLSGPYLEAEFFDDLSRVTGGEMDQALARLTIRESATLWDWMSEQGVRFQPPLSGTLGLDRTNAFFLGGDKALMNALYRSAERLGVAVVYDAEVQALAIEAGVFRSATVAHAGARREVEAGALVAAAGGFEANLEWLREYWGEAAGNFIVRGTPYNRGAVLRLLLDAGVVPIGDPRQCHAVAVDARAPKFDGGIVTRLDCVVFGVVVNQRGERFYDEGEDFWPTRYGAGALHERYDGADLDPVKDAGGNTTSWTPKPGATSSYATTLTVDDSVRGNVMSYWRCYPLVRRFSADQVQRMQYVLENHRAALIGQTLESLGPCWIYRVPYRVRDVLPWPPLADLLVRVWLVALRLAAPRRWRAWRVFSQCIVQPAHRSDEARQRRSLEAQERQDRLQGIITEARGLAGCGVPTEPAAGRETSAD